MSEIKFRLAKPSDAKQIAYVHYHIRDKYDQGFFAQVNYSFLKQYYKVMLNDPNEVFVCAENDEGKILGFNSGSLDATKQFDSMRKHKWSFIWPLMTSAISKPSIIKSALDRFKSTKGESDTQYVSPNGARGEYWGWLSNDKDSDASVEMQERWMAIMKNLGVKEFFFEVDTVNKKIFKFHKINGATILNTYTLPDGRERAEMKYDLTTFKFKFIKL